MGEKHTVGECHPIWMAVDTKVRGCSTTSAATALKRIPMARNTKDNLRRVIEMAPVFIFPAKAKLYSKDRCEMTCFTGTVFIASLTAENIVASFVVGNSTATVSWISRMALNTRASF